MFSTASRITRSPRSPRLHTLVLVCLVLLLPLVVSAATEGPYTYIVSDNKATITGFDFSYSGTLSITNKLGGYPVAAIGDRAFYKRTSLISANIPDEVTSIGFAAFYGCSSLVSITIPGSVTNIGDHAFGGCSALTSIAVSENNLYYASNNGILFNKTLSVLISCPRGLSGHVAIPDGVTSIGDFAFFGCSVLTSITIPNSVTFIGDYAFGDCTALTSVIIPDNITYIGRAAFAGCPLLHTVVLGASLANIGNWAFYNCPSLTKVHGRGNAPAYGLSILDETPATIHHLPGATGWSYSLCDRPAVCWNPAFNPASPPRFDSGAFAFALTGSADIPVRIEACDNLAAPIWTPPPAPHASTALSFRIERRALEVVKVVTPRAPRLRPRPCGRQLF